MKEPRIRHDFEVWEDQHLLRPDRLYYALVWWLFWNREARLSLRWLLRYHRRPFAWHRATHKELLP